MKHQTIRLQAAILTAALFLGAGVTVQAASSGLSFKAPKKLPAANAGAPYVNGAGFSFCVPVPAGSLDLCPGGGGTPVIPKGGNPPYHFQLGGGAFLPFGMTLDLNGLLHGTPNLTDKGPFTFSVCAVDNSANSVCAPVTLTVFNLDGHYLGTFKGTATFTDSAGTHKQSIHGPVDANIASLAITVNEPGDGTGSVTPLGVADFASSGQVGPAGADCTYAGSFVTGKIGATKAAGTFHCDLSELGITGEATGTWSAKQVP